MRRTNTAVKARGFLAAILMLCMVTSLVPTPGLAEALEGSTPLEGTGNPDPTTLESVQPADDPPEGIQPAGDTPEEGQPSENTPEGGQPAGDPAEGGQPAGDPAIQSVSDPVTNDPDAPAIEVQNATPRMLLRANSAGDPYNIASGPVVINSSTLNDWNNRTVTGSINARCTATSFSTDALSACGQRGAIVVDGVDVNLTISNLSVTAYRDNEGAATVSPILLVNGAKLTLTLAGTNSLTACFGGAGICVPKDCELTILGDGSLTATGGDSGPYASAVADPTTLALYWGGAGIGAAAKTKEKVEPSTGTIRIKGGTISAKGGSDTYNNGGSAGIGGSCNCGAGTIDITGGTVTAQGGAHAAAIGNGLNFLANPLGGSIHIGDNANITAIGANNAAAIGGGAYNSVSEITIDGGIVTANRAPQYACAIGSGYGSKDWSGTNLDLAVPTLNITENATVTATGNIGSPASGDYSFASSTFTLGNSASVSCTEEVTYPTATNHTLKVTVYDPSITTDHNGQQATLALGSATPTAGTASVSQAGMATFTVQKIVDYGSSQQTTVNATAVIGSDTFAPAQTTLDRAAATCNVYVGYQLHARGSVFSTAIAEGQSGTLTVAGTEIPDATITCTQGKAAVDARFYKPEGTDIEDGSDYVAPVTLTVGDTTFTIGNVSFKKNGAHQKTGSFQQGTDSIEYVDEGGATQTATGFTRLTNGTTQLTDGWYAVYPGETIDLSGSVEVSGTVHLIVGDGATLNASKGIGVGSGATLVVYGQADNNGVLNATGSNRSAGIGGAKDQTAGTIKLYGGVVEAHGHEGGAGIGGGLNGDGGSTTIAGNAVVRAYGGGFGGTDQTWGGAGIGGGGRNASIAGSKGGTITIGGTANVTAQGIDGGAGIGGGYSYEQAQYGHSGAISIGGTATVVATGGTSGAGIGAGCHGCCDNISITESATITATGGQSGAGIGLGSDNTSIPERGAITIHSGKVSAQGGANGAGIGVGYGAWGLPIITIHDGVVSATGGQGASDIGWGRYEGQNAGDRIFINGGQVTATGSGINAYSGQIFLSWKNESSDYITCNGSYTAWGGIFLNGNTPFMVKGTSNRASGTTPDNINFKKATIVPVATVTLQEGDSGSATQTVEVARGDTYTVPDCPFTTPADKEFIGWHKDGDTESLLAPGDVIKDVPLATTLTAVWGQTYSVTVNDGVKNFISASPTTSLAGTLVTLTLDYPAYLSYVTGSLTVTKQGESGALPLSWTGEKTCVFTMPEGNVVVTGTFVPNTSPVPYVDAAGASYQTPEDGYLSVAATDTQWTKNSLQNGWYVVQGNVELSDRVTVSGDVNLVLCDNTTLTASGGINVPSGSSLTIWAQSLGNAKGKLVARTKTNGYRQAAIGGNEDQTCGSITINGGAIDARPGSDSYRYGAAIGSGGGSGGSTVSSPTPGNITINGGTITAVAGTYGAAIGAGYRVNCGSITINGGTIEATAGVGGGAAIGSGQYSKCGNITISGGSITAHTTNTHFSPSSTTSDGAGIGSGTRSSSECGNITISGGTINVTADAGGAAIGSGGESGTCGTITISDGSVTVSSNYGAGIGSGEDGTCNGITISGGTVIANGGDNGNGDGAGIGSGEEALCIGSIAISGGTVTATSNGLGAAIGHGKVGGSGSSNLTLSITGGLVTAELKKTQGSNVSVAAIGSGDGGGGVHISISGGTVKAYGNANTNSIIFRSIGSPNRDTVTLSYDDEKRDTCVYADAYGPNINLSKQFVNKGNANDTYGPNESLNPDDTVNGKTIVAANSYDIAIDPGIAGGTITPSVYRTAKDQQVTLTVTPNADHRLNQESLEVTYTEDGASKTITPTQDSTDSSKFTFTMPAADVVVSAQFYNHQHSFTYESDGTTITATCNNNDLPCDLPDHKATFTIAAPTGDLTYNGAQRQATVRCSSTTLDVPAVTYATTDGTSLSEAPKNAGTYTASIALGEGTGKKTASVTYTIKPKPVSIAGLSAKDKTYDGTTSATVEGTASVSGAFSEDDVTAVTGTAEFADPNVGTGKTVYFSGCSLTGNAAGNYQLVGQPSTTASIQKLDTAITASDQTVEYGGTIQTGANMVTASSLAQGHTVSSVTITPNPSSTNQLTNEGTIVPSNARISDASGRDVTDNYNITSYTQGKLTITKATPEVSAPTKVEGLTYTGQGLALVVAGSTTGGTLEYALGSADQAPTEGWGTTVPTQAAANTYHVWYRVIGDDYYNSVDPACVSVNIAKKSLTITANSTSITYGSAPTTNGVTYSGFVQGENESVLTDTPQLTCAYQQYGNAGTYSIVPSGCTATNYEITFKPGTLTVRPKTVAVAWSNTALTYNGNAQAPTATIKHGDLLNGDAVSVTVSGAQTNAGGGYVATAAALVGAKAGNYALPTEANLKTTTFAIAKATHATESSSAAAIHGSSGSAELAALIARDGHLGEVRAADANGVLAGVPSVTGTRLFFSLRNTRANVGKTATATVRVAGARNYLDYNIVVTITATGKQTISPAVSLSSWTYGQPASTPVVTGNPGGGVVSYAYKAEGSSDATYTEHVPSEPGSYVVRATVAETAEYYGGTATARFEVARASADVSYAAHSQGLGWNAPAGSNGNVAGTTGQSKRLEAITAQVQGGTIEYRSHVQGIGWEHDWAADGAMSGTTGQSKRLEAMQMRLGTGLAAQELHVWYRVHAQGYGWMGWAKDGEPAGTAGLSKRLEAYEVLVLGPGQVPEGYDASRPSFVGAAWGNAHVQGIGWQDAASTLRFGTIGQSKRLEALRLSLGNQPWTGGIEYNLHLQRIGWQGWRANGELAGTIGESRRAEAVCIRLTGELADHMNVWYRVHSQTFGWLGWTHDGEEAGTTGLSKRAEAVDVQILPKGQVPSDYDASQPAIVTP